MSKTSEKLYVRNVVEPQFVDIGGNSDNSDPVTELVLLQELFGEVFKVSLGESDVGSDGQLSLTCVTERPLE